MKVARMDALQECVCIKRSLQRIARALEVIAANAGATKDKEEDNGQE